MDRVTYNNPVTKSAPLSLLKSPPVFDEVGYVWRDRTMLRLQTQPCYIPCYKGFFRVFKKPENQASRGINPAMVPRAGLGTKF